MSLVENSAHRPRCNGLCMRVYACVYVYIQWKSLSKCDLLTPGLRVEAATLAVGDEMVQISVTKCNKV